MLRATLIRMVSQSTFLSQQPPWLEETDENEEIEERFGSASHLHILLDARMSLEKPLNDVIHFLRDKLDSVVRYNVGRRDSVAVSVFGTHVQDVHGIIHSTKGILDLSPPTVLRIRNLMELYRDGASAWPQPAQDQETTATTVDPLRNAIHHGTFVQRSNSLVLNKTHADDRHSFLVSPSRTNLTSQHANHFPTRRISKNKTTRLFGL